MNRADKKKWFKGLKWGVFCHYLADPASHAGTTKVTSDEWNKRVDSFDTDRLAEQLASVNAGYFFITLGQNSGHYIAPNETYDNLTGIKPSLCAKRDLVNDLYESLAKKGIPLFLYATAEPPMENPIVLEKLNIRENSSGEKISETNRITPAQMLNWEDVTRDFSQRWGKKINGWWVDGLFVAEDYDFPTAPNVKSLSAAFRAGNQDCLLSYNPGIQHFCVRFEDEDYTAGEQDGTFHLGQWKDGKFGPYPDTIDGAQLHFLNFAGSWWGQGSPRFPTELVTGYTKYVNGLGGVMSWDIPVSHDGKIPDDFMTQLAAIKS